MIRDLIEYQLVSVGPNTTVKDVALTMEEEDVGAVLVTEQGKPMGIITDRDIVLRCVNKDSDPDECFAKDIMTKSLETVKETDGLFDCIAKMRDAKVRRIPVVNDQGGAVGLISFGDLLSVLSKEFYELTQTTTPAEEYRKKAA